MPKGYKFYHIESKEWYGPFAHFSELLNAAKASQLTPDEVVLFRDYRDYPLKPIHVAEYSETKVYWEKVGEFTIPLEYRDWADYPKYNIYIDKDRYIKLINFSSIKYHFYILCIKLKEIFQLLT